MPAGFLFAQQAAPAAPGLLETLGHANPGALILLAGFLIVFTAIVAETLKSMAKMRGQLGLKRLMVERGMSAEEIVGVITSSTHTHGPEHSTSLPCASEVVVEVDGEWCPALVLRVGEGQYYAHVVGGEMSANAWYPAARVRIPADSNLATLATAAPPVKEPMYADL